MSCQQVGIKVHEVHHRIKLVTNLLKKNIDGEICKINRESMKSDKTAHATII